MSEVKWYRKLGAIETMLHKLNLDGCARISYVMRVSTSRPLTEDDARTVFVYLYRKLPNLRLCIDEKDGELWFKHMTEEKIDFQVDQDADIYQVYHGQKDYKFNYSEGPLWAARFLPWSDKHIDFVRSTISKNETNENTMFTHVSHIIFYSCHTITDGYSTCRITREIIRLLNDVLSGNEISNAQIGKLLDVNREVNEIKQIEEKFRKDPHLLEQRKKSYFGFVQETLFEKCYPVKPFVKPETFCLFHSLDEDTSAKLFTRCKKEGVTVHTGFCTLIEAAIIKALQNKGIEQEHYKMTSLHCADNRNYYEHCDYELGAGISVPDLNVNISKNISTDFWTEAKKYHEAFKSQHKCKAGLAHFAIEALTAESPMEFLDKNGQSSPSKKMCHYMTTNMGDLNFLLGDCGENIRLEFLDRHSTAFLFPQLWMNGWHTIRGRLMHSLQYNANVIDRDTAQMISDTMFEILNSVC